MRKVIISIVLLSSTICNADEQSGLQSGSAMYTGIHANKEREEYERLMEDALTRIGECLKKDCEWCTDDGDEYYDLLYAIRKNQSAWESYVNAECELLYRLEGPPWNTWASTRWTQCKADQAYTRLQQLKKVEYCLKSDDGDGEGNYSLSCINRLAPLSFQHNR